MYRYNTCCLLNVVFKRSTPLLIEGNTCSYGVLLVGSEEELLV